MPSIILNLHAKKDGKDHLTSLPVEVQQNIIGHLFCSHNPDQITTYDPEAARHDHSLDNLAATSKALRDEVMAFARTWLRRHSDITEFDKSVKEVAKVNHLRGPEGILTWAEKHCVYCGKYTVRSAIMMNGFRCCKKCDATHWPDKITLPEAQSKYDLKLWDVLKLHHGLCASSGDAVDMFTRKDVEKLTKLVHKTDDLEAFFATKAVERAERKRKADLTLEIIATEEARQKAARHHYDIWSPSVSSIFTLPDISELPSGPFGTPGSMSTRRRHTPPMIQTGFFHTTYNFPNGHTFTHYSDPAPTPRKLAEARKFEEMSEAFRRERMNYPPPKPVVITPRSTMQGLRAFGIEMDTPTAMKMMTGTS